MKAPPSPKIEALEALAKAMSQLKLDKLKGYKKTNAKDPMAEVPVDEESEEEMPVLEAEAMPDEEEEVEEDGGKPKGFSEMLASLAKKKSKSH